MSALKPLFSVVEALLSEHEQLLTIAKHKKDVLIKGDMEALNAIVKNEAELVQRIERLEAERLGAVRLLAARLGLAAEQVTARAIATIAQGDEALRMNELNDRLRAVVDELKRLNELNKQLIAQSMQFVRFSIELLTESPAVPTYGGTGQTNNPYVNGRMSYFDSKA